MDAVQPHRSPTYILAAIAALSVCVCFSGCSEMRDSGGPPGTQGDTTAPTVVSISPACNSTNVALNSVVTVTFTEALKVSTVNSNTVSLSGPAGQVSGSVTYDSSSNSATVTPSTNLTPNATYTVSVGAGATDLNGNALA